LKKKMLLVIVLICLFVGIPVFFYDALHGNIVRDYLMEKQVKEYLIAEGYKKDEILSVEAEYNMKLNTKKVKGTAAKVLFKDEPEDKYLYIQMRKTGDIRQECMYYSEDTKAYEVDYTEERKHMVRDCY
jgi:hypothetical protein